MRKPVFGGGGGGVSDTNRAIRIAKTKALISFAVTEKLICVFVFAYTNIRFSHDTALIISGVTNPHTPNVQFCFIKASA